MLFPYFFGLVPIHTASKCSRNRVSQWKDTCAFSHWTVTHVSRVKPGCRVKNSSTYFRIWPVLRRWRKKIWRWQDFTEDLECICDCNRWQQHRPVVIDRCRLPKESLQSERSIVVFWSLQLDKCSLISKLKLNWRFILHKGGVVQRLTLHSAQWSVYTCILLICPICDGMIWIFCFDGSDLT